MQIPDAEHSEAEDRFVMLGVSSHVERVKKQLTIRLDAQTLGYFQDLSREMALP